MDTNLVKEKMELRNEFLIKKREAQKSRKSEKFIMSFEYDIKKIDSELMELANLN